MGLLRRDPADDGVELADGTPGSGAVGHLDEMDSDIAARWDLWSVQIGHAIHPEIDALQQGLPAITAVMVCTADGLNLCSVGLDEQQVGRLAAMATSLYAVAATATAITRTDGGESRSSLSMSMQDDHGDVVVLSMHGLVVGSLLMWVAASGASLGGLLVRARRTAQRIVDLLADDSPAA